MNIKDLKPDQYEVEQPTSEVPNDEVSKTESALRGVLQGGTFGFADEAAGGLGAAGDVLTGKRDLTDIIEAYRQNRDDSRNAYRAAEEANPMSYLAGNVGGGLATALIPGAAPATLGKLITAGTIGGVGSSEGDLTKGDVGQVAQDAAIGGGIGAATFGLNKAAQGAAEAAKDTELGQKLARQWRLGQQGVKTFNKSGQDAAEAKLVDIGKDTLKDINAGVTAGASARDAALATGTQDVSAGLKITAENLRKGGIPMAGLDASDATGSDVNKILNTYNKMNNVASGTVDNALMNPAEKAAAKAAGAPGVFAKDVNALTRSVSELTALGDNSLQTADGKKLIQSTVNELKKLEASALTPQAAQEVAAARKQMSNFLQAKEAIIKAEGNALTPLDKIGHEGNFQSTLAQLEKSGPAGLKSRERVKLAEDLIRQVDPGMADKFVANTAQASDLSTGLRDVNKQSISGLLNFVQTGVPKGMNVASNAYRGGADFVKGGSQVFASMGQKLMGSNVSPAVKQKLGRLLSVAAGSTEQKRAALLYGIQQNPEYRQAMEQIGAIVIPGVDSEK